MRVLIALDGSNSADVVLAAIAPWLRHSAATAELITIMDASEIRETLSPGLAHELTPQGSPSGSTLRVAEPMPRVAEERTQALTRVRGDLLGRLDQLAREHLAG